MKAQHLFHYTGLALLLSTINYPLSTFAQGSLTPPGPPGPTMKSLDQIEPRTPISSAPFTITQPGSYYLTTNVTVTSGDAITINANNVSLDLNGFTISSAAPVANIDKAILLSGSLNDIAIRNGHISSGVTNNGAGVYSGSGFGFGVYGLQGNVRVSGLSVSGCQYDGIYVGYGATVESCVVSTVGAYGIQARSVSDSTASDCGADAISASTANNCVGLVSGSGSGVSATTANNCWGSSAGNGYGVYANGNAQNCYGSSSSLTGHYAYTAQNCYGYSPGNGDGVAATTAENCWGSSAGNGVGIYAQSTALNCYGRSSSSTGISAATAQNCYGYTSGNDYGLYAEIAIGCFGYSFSGVGVYAFIANVCHGTTSSGTALTATHNVNSY